VKVTFPISPPNFSRLEEQLKWIGRYEGFRIGLGSSKNQINALIHIMGDKADRLSEEEKKKYDTVKAKHKHTRFNQWQQQEGETVSNFITSLYSLADRCDYGTLQNEIIRD